MTTQKLLYSFIIFSAENMVSKNIITNQTHVLCVNPDNLHNLKTADWVLLCLFMRVT